MKIAVAVSGGIDSLFSSLLLKEKGYDVVGVLGIFTPELYEIKDHVVKGYESLKIPSICLDLIFEFEEKVIKYFVDSYLKGLTPNPCCLCNRYIKFGLIMDKIKDMGLNLLATGHYAKLKIKDDTIFLSKGIDTNKDQSYFLSLVPPQNFSRVKFPLGNYTKEEVRVSIAKRNLRPFVSSESQEICFVKTNYRDFLKKRGIELPGPGEVMGVWGDRMGTHSGLFNYTIGQRRGLKIPYKEPLYVIDKDIEQNILIVGTKKDLMRDKCVVNKINYLVDINKWPEQVDIKTNYNMKPKKSNWKRCDTDKIVFYFEEMIPKPTPGQICCIYQGDIVLGGGIICDEK